MNSYIFCSKIKAASAREPQARSANVQRKLGARSASREGEARAHLLPQPGRAQAARLVVVAATVMVTVATARLVVVAVGCPDR